MRRSEFANPLGSGLAAHIVALHATRSGESMSTPSPATSNEEIALHNMEAGLRRLEKLVPPPRDVPFHGHTVLRYVEQTIEQAIVAKLARYISLLSGAKILLEHGQVHEQALLQRALDEAESDIAFLSLAVIRDDFTERHKEFLEEFWKEEFDAPKAMDSTQDRAPPRRDKIRAWIANTMAEDPSTAIKADRSLYKSFSGYVHGAAPHIMDLHDGRRFRVRGVLGTSRHKEHESDLWNYYYRGICAVAFAARALGDEELFQAAYKERDEFAVATGRSDL